MSHTTRGEKGTQNQPPLPNLSNPSADYPSPSNSDTTPSTQIGPSFEYPHVTMSQSYISLTMRRREGCTIAHRTAWPPPLSPSPDCPSLQIWSHPLNLYPRTYHEAERRVHSSTQNSMVLLGRVVRLLLTYHTQISPLSRSDL